MKNKHRDLACMCNYNRHYSEVSFSRISLSVLQRHLVKCLSLSILQRHVIKHPKVADVGIDCKDTMNNHHRKLPAWTTIRDSLQRQPSETALRDSLQRQSSEIFISVLQRQPTGT